MLLREQPRFFQMIVLSVLQASRDKHERLDKSRQDRLFLYIYLNLPWLSRESERSSLLDFDAVARILNGFNSAHKHQNRNLTTWSGPCRAKRFMTQCKLSSQVTVPVPLGARPWIWDRPDHCISLASMPPALPPRRRARRLGRRAADAVTARRAGDGGRGGTAGSLSPIR
jgi:hypothetical protein